MKPVAHSLPLGYFPAIVRVECDSPLDALIALCVPRHEAMDLVVASWWPLARCGLLTTVDGGRPVVALRTPEGRWAACNAYLGDICLTVDEAAQRLQKRLRRQGRGYVAATQGGHQGCCIVAIGSTVSVDAVATTVLHQEAPAVGG